MNTNLDQLIQKPWDSEVQEDFLLEWEDFPFLHSRIYVNALNKECN